MLKIVLPAGEYFDPVNECFIETKEVTLQLEHSLISISKWESKWCIPFFSKESRTNDQTLDYIKCMIVTPQNITSEQLLSLTNDQINEVVKYINAPMSASTVKHINKNGNVRGETVTSELIYYWMIAQGIPMECEKWHLNRLIMLIDICSVKNAPGKKMSKRAVMEQNAALNAARRAKYNSRG